MKTQVKIDVNGLPVNVDSIDVQGDFALHKSLNGKTFNVTHIPTGCFVISDISKQKTGAKYLKMLAEAPSFSEGLSRVAAIKKVDR